MNLTLFLLLISIGFISLFTVLLTLKRIRNLVYFSLTALLVLFDFAVLSLDKIYFLHKEQDDKFVEAIAEKERAMDEKLGLFKELTDVQLDLVLASITQSSASESEAAIRQKIKWRDQLVSQLTILEYEDTRIEFVQSQINHAVHRYLMEQLNQSVIEHLGHRTYGEFVRTRPRHEWTDPLFISELEAFLEKDALMNDSIKQRLHVLKVFDQSGVLL